MSEELFDGLFHFIVALIGIIVSLVWGYQVGFWVVCGFELVLAIATIICEIAGYYE